MLLHSKNLPLKLLLLSPFHSQSRAIIELLSYARALFSSSFLLAFINGVSSGPSHGTYPPVNLLASHNISNLACPFPSGSIFLPPLSARENRTFLLHSALAVAFFRPSCKFAQSPWVLVQVLNSMSQESQ